MEHSEKSIEQVVSRGKTMAEVDAYYEGLLKEIKELQEMLGLKNKERQEDYATGT